MAVRSSQPRSGARRALRRFFLSAFVVVSFILYALQKPADNTQGNLPASSPNPNDPVAQQAPLPTDAAPTDVQPTATTASADGTAASAPGASPQGTPASPTQAQPQPTDTTAPTATTASTGAFKDGTYTGPEVDAYYGLVKVQATVQNGKVTNVQFLEYPNDRRTSVRINTIAVPDLQQEALQAQSANVDIISGATLTSQAFIQSLQPALDQAQK